MKRALYFPMIIIAGIAFFPGAAIQLRADTIIISQDGIWGSGVDCPPVYCNAPGDSWNWAFAMSVDPAPVNFDLGNDFEAAITNFEVSDNGTVIASLTNTQTEVTFFSTLQCGGLATDDDTSISECSGQLYSGDESAPNMQPGSYAPLLNPLVGNCGPGNFEPCATVTFGNIVITDVATPTPEPSPALMIIVPLLAVILVIRKRKAGQTLIIPYKQMMRV
jgi:hypothetical protein